MKIIMAFAGDITGSGGMQKACITIANALGRRGHQLVIAVCNTNDKAPFFSLSGKVKRVSLLRLSGIEGTGALGRKISRKDKCVREMLRVFSRKSARTWNEKAKVRVIRPGIKKLLSEFKPDAVISFSPETSFYFQAAGCGQPIITCFRIQPHIILDISPQCEINAVKKSAAVQIQMPFFDKEIADVCGPVNMACIPNPVEQIPLGTDLRRDKTEYVIADVGRIDKPQKRQHLILEAFAKVHSQFANWHLDFWGSDKGHAGYAKELQDRIAALHLEGSVFLRGATRNVADVYRNADIFAFPSAFEGFPNALAEAMSYGLPSLVFSDCPSSMGMIQDGVNGLAADSVEQAAEKLSLLMGNREMRIKLGKAARKSMEQYAPDRIWDMWEQLLKQVTDKTGA